MEEEEDNLDGLIYVKGQSKMLKEIIELTLHEHFKTGLCNLKSQSTDQTLEELQKFASLDMLNSTPFDRYNFHTKNVY